VQGTCGVSESLNPEISSLWSKFSKFFPGVNGMAQHPGPQTLKSCPIARYARRYAEETSAMSAVMASLSEHVVALEAEVGIAPVTEQVRFDQCFEQSIASKGTHAGSRVLALDAGFERISSGLGAWGLAGARVLALDAGFERISSGLGAWGLGLGV